MVALRIVCACGWCSMNNYPREIEEATATAWLQSGAISVDCYGNENTYYLNEFGSEFYCKNYPHQYTDCVEGSVNQ